MRHDNSLINSCLSSNFLCFYSFAFHSCPFLLVHQEAGKSVVILVCHYKNNWPISLGGGLIMSHCSEHVSRVKRYEFLFVACKTVFSILAKSLTAYSRKTHFWVRLDDKIEQEIM